MAIRCQVQARTPHEAEALENLVCDSTRALAARRLTLPVRVVQPGDPALVRADAVVMLVQAAVRVHAGQPALALSLRLYRPGVGDGEVPFGAPPRIATIDGGRNPSLSSELDAALGDLLPGQPEQPRELPRPHH